MGNKTMRLIEGATMKGVIQETYDYSKFKFHPKNRKVRRDKKDNIKKSMAYRDILNPILVNENLEIGEGQHRFLARQELGLPIVFIIVEGLDVEAMQILNNTETKSNWEHEDYLDMYVKQEIEDYITFKEIINKYKIKNFTDVFHIICELTDNDLINEKEMANLFDLGKFKITAYDYVIDFLEELSLFDKYDYSRHTSFVRAFFKLYIEDFYDKEYIRKRIDIQQFTLVNGRKSTIADYGVYLAEQLYSDKKREMRCLFDIDTNQFYEYGGSQGKRKGKKRKLIKAS